jgi:hypothetical protein
MEEYPEDDKSNVLKVLRRNVVKGMSGVNIKLLYAIFSQKELTIEQ